MHVLTEIKKCKFKKRKILNTIDSKQADGRSDN